MAKVISKVTKQAKLDKRTLSGKAAYNKIGKQKTVQQKMRKSLKMGK
jgi:hypothetical protein